MPRCQGWSEDYDSDSWPISDVRLHARSLKISCHPCSAIPVVCTPVQSFTYLTDLYSSMLNWGEGNGNPLQYSCLENPRDRGAWWAPIYGLHRVGHDWSDLAAAACWIEWGELLEAPWIQSTVNSQRTFPPACCVTMNALSFQLVAIRYRQQKERPALPDFLGSSHHSHWLFFCY